MTLYDNKSALQRVNRNNPCPICGKFDWCSVFSDGHAAICMRIEDGSVKHSVNGGFIHILTAGYSPRISRIVPDAPVQCDFNSTIRDFQRAINPPKLDKLAIKLGITTDSLIRMGIGWDYLKCAWAFPMCDVSGNVRGIRLRRDNGDKFGVKGGREGLFIPANLPMAGLILRNNPEPLLIPEGVTDCAALLDLGFTAIGRPSCTGGIKLLVEWLEVNRPTHLVIVADGDLPGQRGAESLASTVLPYVPTLRVITPPDGVKDVRDWKRAGATREAILQTIEAAPIQRMKIKSRIVSAKGVCNGF